MTRSEREQAVVDMITVVERPDVITRICCRDAEEARALLARLRLHMREEGWLAVTMSIVVKQPYRSRAEVERASEIINLRWSGS